MAFLIGTILFYMGASINKHFSNGHFSINSAQLLLLLFLKGHPIEFFEFNKGGKFVDYQLRGH